MKTDINKRIESINEVMTGFLSKAAIKSIRDIFLAMPESEFKRAIVVDTLDELLK